MEANLQIKAAVYLVIMLIVNDVFVRFTIMKLKYIVSSLFIEYSSLRIYIMFLLIKCVIATEIFD